MKFRRPKSIRRLFQIIISISISSIRIFLYKGQREHFVQKREPHTFERASEWQAGKSYTKPLQLACISFHCFRCVQQILTRELDTSFLMQLQESNSGVTIVTFDNPSHKPGRLFAGDESSQCKQLEHDFGIADLQSRNVARH